MIVYIDVVFLISFVQNSCLLLISGMCLKENLNLWRIVIGGMSGAVYQLFCIRFSVNSVLLSFIIAYILVFISYGNNRIKLTFCFITVSVMTAGIMYMLSGMYMIVTFFLCIGVIPFTARYVKNELRISNLNRTVEITVKKSRIKLNGFVDSGNGLKTIIIGKHQAVKLLGKERATDLLSFKEGGVVPCTTVKGISLLPVFIADSVTVDGKYTDIKIGVMKENLCYAILPVEFLEGTDIDVKRTGAQAEKAII